MTEPVDLGADEFEDVLGALAGTALAAGPRGHDAVAAALLAPARPERVAGVEAAIARDADEAWSLAVAFLGDEEAAWQAVVGGFVALGRGDCAALSAADSLRAVAAASLEVWRLLAKAGATHEVLGHALPPEQRAAILLRGGLRRRDVALDGGDPAEALVAAFPQPGHPRGDELCRLLARQLLGPLEPDEVQALAALRRDHPTSAALIRQRYAELAEVPVLVLARTDELVAAVRAQLAREATQRERVGAVRLRVTVTCAFCHDGLSRDQAVFCAGCLAPHHEECFMTHGTCSVHGCGQTQVVKAGAPAPLRRPGPARKVALAGAAVLLAGLGALGGVAAWRAQLVPGGPGGPDEAAERPVVPTDPAVLREAEARTAKLDEERAKARARREALMQTLRDQQVSVEFERTPFRDCVDQLSEQLGWNIVLSSDAGDLIDNESVSVALVLSNISAEHALRLIVASNDELTFTVDEPRLIRIGTKSGDLGELQLEVYDVADIVSGAARERGGFQVDADKLIELLERTGERGDSDPITSAEYNSGVLILRAVPEGHQSARELLAYLRGAKTADASARPAWMDALAAKLETRGSLDAKELALAEVVSRLQELSGANICVSPAVDQNDTTVTLKVKDAPLADILKLVLEQTKLASTYRYESIFICPREEVAEPCTLRILDARDLGWLDPDALVQAIQTATGPENWDEPSHLDAHREQLIVYQTPAMHEAIDQALAKLRLGHARNLETSKPR